MSEAARALHLGTGRRIIDDLVREQRLAAEAARAMNQETARRAFEDLRRKRRLEDEAAHARHQEDARRFTKDLRRKHRLSFEAASAPPPASAATTTSSRAMPRTPPPATAPGVHAVSDASSLLRVRNFLVLADAAAIALNLFRLQTDTLVAELGFNDQPRTDERFGRILQGISAPLKELNLVRSAVFTSDPKTTGQSFVACLQDCYQSRGYTAERCEDPAYLATETFLKLRGPIGPPGVNFEDVREPDDGWNSWRANYAADGHQLTEYLRIRTQIIGLAGVHERDIISREQYFTSHPICWPTRYTTSALVRMAEEAHGIARDMVPESVVTATISAEPAAVSSSRGGRRPLSESTKPSEVAKLNIYEQVRSQKRTNPKWGALSLLHHFKADNAFKLLVVQAELPFGKKLFATALVWVNANPIAQETQ